MNKKSTLRSVANDYLTHPKSNSGITLIALVITIIVLLILAGISISMLSGDNSILQKAGEANDNTRIAQIRERIQLAELAANTDGLGNLEYENLTKELNQEFGENKYTISAKSSSPWVVTVDGVTYTIGNPNGKTVIPLETASKGTEPYYPSESFSRVEGTDLSTGLVITDNVDESGKSTGNEYVWIEVPSTFLDSTVTDGPDYSALDALTESDKNNKTDAYYAAIETALENYVNPLVDRGSREDEWYDRYGVSYSGAGEAGLLQFHLRLFRRLCY